jgi:hypothetical protein
MKTAMQELIEIFNHELKLEENTLSNEEGYMLKWAIFNAKSLLEKEKEQIIEASNNVALKSMVHREKLDTMSEDELRDSLVEDTISYGEEYYNQTYNQNK